MIFKKLTIENYKSFQLPTEIIFPGRIGEKSIFLIGGMNGSGKTSVMEAINYCLYGAKSDEIFRNINRKEKEKRNIKVAFELEICLDDNSELVVKRSWNSNVLFEPQQKDLIERLFVTKDGKELSFANNQIWQDFLRSSIPFGITQFFFFDGEKIQEIASDDHSEVRLKASLEAALGIQYITQLATDISNIKQEERKTFTEISDEDLEFKNVELSREKSVFIKKRKERDEQKNELDNLRLQYEDVKNRFQLIFQVEPETKDAVRLFEKNRNQAKNRLIQIENEIKTKCEKYLPFAILSKLFDGFIDQIEIETDFNKNAVIRENAAQLAKKIVRVVEEPEPIFDKTLSNEKMVELENRIFRLLKEDSSSEEIAKIINLSDRDSAKVLQQIENIETSDIDSLIPLLEEKKEVESQILFLEEKSQRTGVSENEREFYNQLQSEMEGYATQIGRKTEQIQIIEEEIILLEKKINDLEAEIGRLYEKHNLSKEKTDFINQCEKYINLLNNFVISLRKSKVHMLQEKTFEMFCRLSNKYSLIKNITIDDSTYEISIIDRNNHVVRKSSLSAGEKEVFALSLLWGLSQTSQLRLPIIIDTPLSRLDSSHRDNIVKNYFPNAGEQVIILSTDTEIDRQYYRSLSPHLTKAASLEYDIQNEMTIYKPGYFWEN